MLDKKNPVVKKGRKPTTLEACLAMILVIIVILCCIKIQLVLETALILGALVAAIFGFYLGYSWDDIEKGNHRWN